MPLFSNLCFKKVYFLLDEKTAVFLVTKVSCYAGFLGKYFSCFFTLSTILEQLFIQFWYEIETIPLSYQTFLINSICTHRSYLFSQQTYMLSEYFLMPKFVHRVSIHYIYFVFRKELQFSHIYLSLFLNK